MKNETEQEIEKGKFAIIENCNLRKKLEAHNAAYNNLLKDYNELKELYSNDTNNIGDLVKNYEFEKQQSEIWRLRALKAEEQNRMIDFDDVKIYKKWVFTKGMVVDVRF